MDISRSCLAYFIRYNYNYVFKIIIGNTSTDEDDEEVENIASTNRITELENEVTTEQQQQQHQKEVVTEYDETSTDMSSSDMMGEQDAIRVSRDEVFYIFIHVFLFFLRKFKKHKAENALNL